MEAQWWLTLSRGGFCGNCGSQVRAGHKIAYRHEDKALLCEECVSELGIAVRPARALLERQELLQEKQPGVTVLPDDPAIARATSHPYKRTITKKERKIRRMRREAGLDPQVPLPDPCDRTQSAAKPARRSLTPAERAAVVADNIERTKQQGLKPNASRSRKRRRRRRA
jgi:hypothetical protein